MVASEFFGTQLFSSFFLAYICCFLRVTKAAASMMEPKDKVSFRPSFVSGT